MIPSSSPGRPLVSIGMPLYNAARYLHEAMEGLLGQEYSNLEIIFCDDASTDETAALCASYVAADSRCRYSLNERNLGAAGNFNRAFALSRGEYFMWAAFDDLRRPEYVRLCLAALEAAPEAIMCCTDVAFIDEEGKPLDLGSYGLERPAGRSATTRIDRLTKGFGWVDVYGLIRRSAFARTQGYRPVFGGDVILTLELCLQGPVLHIPGPLWAVRFFLSKSGEAQAQTIVPTDGTIRMTPSFTDLGTDLLKTIADSPLRWFLRKWLWIVCLINISSRNMQLRRTIYQDSSRPLRRAIQDKRWRDAAVTAVLRSVVCAVHIPAAALRRTRKLTWRPVP